MSRWTAAMWMLWVLFALSATAHATTIEYIHTDALGSIVAVTDAAGALKERREWEPYGEQLTPAPSNGPGYTGHVQDASTGLVYMQQRYYDPVVGRFLSTDPDPVDTATAWNFNRYSYGANNPYKFTDPDGRLVFLIVPLVVAAAETTVGTAVIGTAVLAGGLYVSKQASDAIGAYLNESADAPVDDDAAPSSSKGPRTLEPGPHSGDSIPARGPGRDFTPGEREKVNEIGKESGCHTCGSTDPGTKSGNFVPDHQPPSATNTDGKPQQLYPHCLSCSRTQGGEVRQYKPPIEGRP